MQIPCAWETDNQLSWFIPQTVSWLLFLTLPREPHTKGFLIRVYGLPGREYTASVPQKHYVYRTLSGLQVTKNPTYNKQIGLFSSYILRRPETGYAGI